MQNIFHKNGEIRLEAILNFRFLYENIGDLKLRPWLNKIKQDLFIYNEIVKT